jgi:type IV pilus assembly protein PilB
MLKDKILAELFNANVSIINLVDWLIEYAYSLRASDIHIEPNEDNVRVRFRIDGQLIDSFAFPKNIHLEIIFRIKILTGLRTDEHRIAQDGRFRLVISNLVPLDIRVSIVPTFYDENCVLRLLADNLKNCTFEALGISLKNQEIILQSIKKPHGMILVTGPTGSGKTTTLYAILKMLNLSNSCLITIEDPVEYAMPGIRQIPVNKQTGLNFANGLRSILRQDPDVIMVGEIRDSETAGIAINTALTGHLLLSTLHTNDPAATLPRLLDMGIEAYLVASTINLIIGQRLVRRICDACKTEKDLSEAEALSLSGNLFLDWFNTKKIFYYGRGCNSCQSTGYKGRVALQEIICISEPIRQAILKKASALEIKNLAFSEGGVSLIQDGINKAAEGVTTIEEVFRIAYES